MKISIKNLSKISLQRFFFVIMLESMASNFAHPITPSIIKNLQLGDHVFGTAYAAMSLTCFLFSMFWGRISQHIGIVKVYAIGCFGYALSQCFFFYAYSEVGILLSRSLAGFFIAGINICQLTYIMKVSSIQNQGNNIIYVSTIISVFSAFGYLIGGLMGSYSIPYTFYAQIFILLLCAILLLLLIKDDYQKSDKHYSLKLLFMDCNPFGIIKEIRPILTPTYVLFMFAILLMFTASTAYDQSFNYYLKDVFHFSPSYNGILKAGVGGISLIINFTMCKWVMKKYDIQSSLRVILFVSSFCVITVCCMKQVEILFLMYLLYFALQAMNLTLHQTMVCAIGSKQSIQVAFYNTMKSIGGIIGALCSGFLYGIQATYPFFFAAVLYIIACFCIRKRRER